MKTLIVGLGNPGEKFKNTRHNVGFMAVDLFAKINDFPDFKLQKKSNALVSEKDNIILAKPQAFMNNSGLSVKKLISNFKLKISNSLVVIHDDIDLPVGKIKIVKGRGSAGHKGVESIIKSIGKNNLIRLRIGIGQENKIEAKKVVLENFSANEQLALDEAIKKAANALDLYIKQGLEKAMNEFS